MSLKFLVACLGVILTFSSGVAVGQKTVSSRFEKYEKPIGITVMDWRLLGANLVLIRDKLNSAPGIVVPRLYYDWSTRKVKGVTQVDEKILGQQKIDKVKENLEIAALTAHLAAGLAISELRYADPDFEMEFRTLGTEKSTVYADYKNGKITIY